MPRVSYRRLLQSPRCHSRAGTCSEAALAFALGGPQPLTSGNTCVILKSDEHATLLTATHINVDHRPAHQHKSLVLSSRPGLILTAIAGSIALFLAGFGGGVFIQKYHGVGSWARSFASPPPPSPTLAPGPVEAPEVPLAELPSNAMVALVFGQSNSANHGGTPRRAGPQVYSFAEGRLYHAQDPLPGASGTRGSVWTRLGDQLVAIQRYPAVVFIPIGVGNTQIARWTPTGDLFPRVVAAMAEHHSSSLAAGRA
jgi:hypothetical protein